MAARFSYLFIDTAAAHAEEYAEVLEAANLIIIPVVPSPDDVRSLTVIPHPLIPNWHTGRHSASRGGRATPGGGF